MTKEDSAISETPSSSAAGYAERVTTMSSGRSSSGTALSSRIPWGSFSASSRPTGSTSGPFAAGVVRRAGSQAGEPGRRPISAAEITAVLGRRRAIERALRAIAPDASLAGAAASVPWLPLGQLFGAFAGIRGVGMSKMTKALHRKRPAADPHPRQRRPEVPAGRRPWSPGSVRRARARARPRLPARPGPQPGGGASGPAGTRRARLRAHRGADPRPADLVNRGRGLTGWGLGTPQTRGWRLACSRRRGNYRRCRSSGTTLSSSGRRAANPGLNAGACAARFRSWPSA